VRLAVAAYLARYKGQSRLHNESDLRYYLSWCRDHGLEPLQARRPHVELYVRWMQAVKDFQPSRVSRRLSVVAGFYRTCVIENSASGRSGS
jgi:integrase/recombinase XerD